VHSFSFQNHLAAVLALGCRNGTLNHVSHSLRSAQLHYIDTPDKACTFVYTRDCVDDACVAGAIANYTDRLKDTSLPKAQRAEALKFIVHFVGDIHQPLHGTALRIGIFADAAKARRLMC
jgi:hypothetical protein